MVWKFSEAELKQFRDRALEATTDPKEEATFAAFAEGVAAAFGWQAGDPPHPALADLLRL